MAKRKMPTLNTDETEAVVIGPIVAEETIAEAPKPIAGIVSGCKKLNIRKKPSKLGFSAVVEVVDVGSKVTINPDKSTADWYSVHTESGIDGFCMKKFVTVR